MVLLNLESGEFGVRGKAKKKGPKQKPSFASHLCKFLMVQLSEKSSPQRSPLSPALTVNAMGLPSLILASRSGLTSFSPFVTKYKNKPGLPGGPVAKNQPAMQGTWLQTLVQEDFTFHRATKPVYHSY